MLSSPPKVRSLAAGGSHTLVLLDNGTVRAFGNNADCQCNISLQEHEACILDGGWRCGDGQIIQIIQGRGQCQPPIEFANLDLHARTFSVDDQGTLVTAGYNQEHNQITWNDGDVWMKLFPARVQGLPRIPDGRSITGIAAGQAHSIVLLDDGMALACGRAGPHLDLQAAAGRFVVAAAAAMHTQCCSATMGAC
eukprot:gb/GFBE01007559.1/.p1 GENE.gb/GFBE01007559.1/~~gb/GFBE01007559.1/.p1  ORF type:complete len:194 (+),score=14.47 gb/GFBE01007559.1/:1-582(+)